MSKKIAKHELDNIFQWILDNARTIPVRAKVNGHWGSFTLSELSSEQAMKEAFRLAIREVDRFNDGVSLVNKNVSEKTRVTFFLKKTGKPTEKVSFYGEKR